MLFLKQVVVFIWHFLCLNLVVVITTTVGPSSTGNTLACIPMMPHHTHTLLYLQPAAAVAEQGLSKFQVTLGPRHAAQHQTKWLTRGTWSSLQGEDA